MTCNVIRILVDAYGKSQRILFKYLIPPVINLSPCTTIVLQYIPVVMTCTNKFDE
jgi:hypothetical protein